MPDYDESIIQRAVETLATKQLGEYEHRRRLEALAAGERAEWGPACWHQHCSGTAARTGLATTLRSLHAGCSSPRRLGAPRALWAPPFAHPCSLAPPPAAVHQLRGESGAGAGGEQGAGAPPDLGFSQEEPADVEAAYVAALEELSVRPLLSFLSVYFHAGAQCCALLARCPAS